MALSRIWVSMICVALAFGAASGRGAQLGAAAAQGVQQAVDFCLTVGGMICLWSGVMELMRRCGIAGGLSRLLRPVLRRLFPHAARDAQALDALYEKYGFYGERTLNLVMPGLDGLEKMRALMAQLRREPLQEIAGTKVVRMRDYQDGSVYVMGLGRMDKTPISGSNVLYFELDDGCAFIVRPSGTEPKIKVYILGVGATRPECDERVQRYAQFAETLRG